MSLLDHLPVLLVIGPLLCAPLLVLIRIPSVVRWLAQAVVTATAAGAFWLVQTVNEPISYRMGGWTPPVGIEYRVDKVAALVALVVTSVAAIALLIGHKAARDTVIKGRLHLFYAAYLLCLTGLLGMTMTGDAFNVFVFLEISSLSTYALVAMGRRRNAFVAAFNYLVLGTIGGTFVLIGIGLMFQMTGTLNMADLAERLVEARDTRTIHVALAFMLIGLSVKLAVFPLHQWLPNAYAESPSAVSTFLAGSATKVVYFQLMRVIFTLFGASYIFGEARLGTLLVPLSLLAMFLGSAAAVYQSSLKRLLAYSSIAQVGYLTLALALGTEEGLRAGLLHLMAHAVTKAGMFAVVAIIVDRLGTDHIAALQGLSRRMPITAGLLVLGGIGLIGVPGTAGFVSKLALVDAALGAEHVFVAGAILMSSLIAVVYVWRVVEVMYFKTESEGPRLRERPASFVPAGIFLALMLGMGLYSEPAFELARAGASQLFGGMP